MTYVNIPPGEDLRAELLKQVETVLGMSSNTGVLFDVLFDVRTRLINSSDADEELKVMVFEGDKPRIVDRARRASVTWEGPIGALATEIYYIAR
jgi:hypothetical protein